MEIDADAIAATGGDPGAERRRLSRELIISTAVSFIDTESLTELSMRRLGSSLGVEAMSLYRYVPGRDNLLDGVVEQIIDEMYEDGDVLTEPRDGWQDFLQRLAHGVRRVALAHPNAFPLVASRPPEASWLRPPLRSLAWVETFLSGLISEGFSPTAAVIAYRGFTSFLLGHLLLEVSMHGADIGPLDVLDDQPSSGEQAEDYPHVTRLRAQLSQDHSAAEFEESLEILLDRLTVLLTTTPD